MKIKLFKRYTVGQPYKDMYKWQAELFFGRTPNKNYRVI